MSAGKFIGRNIHYRSFKARVVAQYLGLDIELTPDFKKGETNKSPEYLSHFPIGKFPAFVGSDGFTVNDSNAIAYYLAGLREDSPLVGRTHQETTKILQYILFAESEILQATHGWQKPIQGSTVYFKPAVDQAEKNIDRYLGALNDVLLDKTFLVGERLTVADIVVASDLHPLFTEYLDKQRRLKYRNVTRYFKTIVRQPAFKAIAGEVVLCETPQAYVPPKKDKKDKKPAAEQKQQPKKAEKKDVVAEKEEEPKPAPKPKSKLDLLPPAKMVLDEWKRVYSNNDTKPTAMNWLWEHFDPEGYSFWKVEYKYNDELSKIFMSNNLVGGFFARLERARKYAFGNLLVLGNDGDNQIWGYFIVRGQEVPEEVTDAADYESFDWTKADYKDPRIRAEIEDCFAWEGAALPREYADGKTFK
ncbi:elongation factor EF-1 gamma subunit [Martensiomyces pterosporus]|nr:elongation factor EF-1 gamma subunit [Martensiomyces pterosporus]